MSRAVAHAPTRWPIYRLVLRSTVTRARLGALLALGLVGIVVGAALGTGVRGPALVDGVGLVDGHLATGARFVNAFGLSLLVPVTALVFASAALGDPDEDGTMVYLWLRPVPRSRIVVSAAAASLTVAWPVVVLPLAAAAAATGGGGALVTSTVVAATIGLVAYTGLFCALGLLTQRALMWGLLYIFLWEGFVAGAADSAARLAVRTYARSALSDLSGMPLAGATVGTTAQWLVPLAVAAVALWWATWRLARRDIS